MASLAPVCPDPEDPTLKEEEQEEVSCSADIQQVQAKEGGGGGGGGGPSPEVQRAWEEVDLDTRLHAATWSGTCLASAAGALYLFAGLLLLGLGERHEGGPAVILLCRVLAFFCFHVIPSRLCTSNGAAFSLYGLSPGGGCCSQLLMPSLTPVRMASFARGLGRSGFEVRRAMAVPLLFDAVPGAVVLALLVLPLGGEEQHFGLVFLTIATCVSRLLIASTFHHLMPPPPGALEYFRSMQKRIGHSHVLFLVMAALFSIAVSYAGSWLATLTPILLFMYEVLGVVGAQNSFTQSYVMSSAARTNLSGTGQGLMPSMITCITHCNAESARLAILMCTLSPQDEVSKLVITVALTLVVNVPVRTRYSQRGLHILSGGKWCISNMMSLLFKIKFQMGYPRFFALAAVALARVALGSALLPSAFTLLCPMLLFAGEVLEDVVVSLAERWGFCPHLPPAPKPVGAALARKAAKLAKPLQESSGSTSKRCCAGRRRRLELTDLSTVVPETVAADVMRGHKFNFEPQDITLQMPVWAHFCSVYPGQTNLVLCLIFFGGGVPHVLGLCDEPGYQGVGRGLLWWPFVDHSEPCT